MSKFLFLDDSIYRTKQIQNKFPFAYTCETVPQTIYLLNNSAWDIFSLDHDLCGKICDNHIEKNCGMEIVKYICENKHIIKINKIFIHTLNRFVRDEMFILLSRKKYLVEIKPFKIDNYDFLYK